MASSQDGVETQDEPARRCAPPHPLETILAPLLPPSASGDAARPVLAPAAEVALTDLSRPARRLPARRGLLALRAFGWRLTCAGALKSAYDSLLLWQFRAHPAPEEWQDRAIASP
jgi:hypothetical protein